MEIGEQHSNKSRYAVQLSAFVIAVFACGLLALYFVGTSANDSFEQRQIELDNKINPNTASLESLMRLPRIGRTKAGEIVSYRQQFSRRHEGSLPFKNCQDLQKVKGIGPKTAKNIKELVRFE